MGYGEWDDFERMKKPSLRILAVTAAIATLAVIAIVSRGGSGLERETATATLVPVPEAPPQGEHRASSDEEAIFKRAFWRYPAPGDHIRHAVLSEWLEDGTEVSRWEWFIEVQPSAELKQWLRESNPFSLATIEAAQLPAGAAAAPDWFPESARDFEIRQSRDGQMSILFGQKRNLIFATASGYGLARGVPVAETLTRPPVRRRRSTPPPYPLDPQ